MKRNDCYKCPHRREVPGSAHSACAAVEPIKLRFLQAHMQGNMPTTFTNKSTGEVLLRFDPHGIKNGWCMFPVNFDPVWVECYMPIENNEKP